MQKFLRMYLFLWILWFFWVVDEQDFWLAKYIYAQEGEQWLLKNHWFLKNYLHDLAQKVVLINALVWLVVFLSLVLTKRLNAQQRSLGWYFFSTLMISSVLISVLKMVTGVDCPWDLLMFGGDNYFHPIWHSFSVGTGKCFPAGHAGSAYSYIAVYYVLARTRWASYRYLALALVILCGLVFGGVQQLRGAHFISHDMASLLIAWGVARLNAYWWFGSSEEKR